MSVTASVYLSVCMSVCMFLCSLECLHFCHILVSDSLAHLTSNHSYILACIWNDFSQRFFLRNVSLKINNCSKHGRTVAKIKLQYERILISSGMKKLIFYFNDMSMVSLDAGRRPTASFFNCSVFSQESNVVDFKSLYFPCKVFN